MQILMSNAPEVLGQTDMVNSKMPLAGIAPLDGDTSKLKWFESDLT